MSNRYFPYIRNLFVLLLGIVLLGACGRRPTPPALLEPDVQYQRGVAAFEARQFARAIELLQPFVVQHIGDPRMPDALYTLGRAYVARREWVSAASEFQRLATEFPNHPRALPARLATCEAYVNLSPRPQLDQQYTYAALLHCEAVASGYPGTSEAEQARQHVAEMRHKLAQKEFETGMFYFRRRAFDASVIYFQRAVEEFPDTTVAPAALLRLHEAYSLIGYVEEAQETRERLLRDYPQSPEAQSLRA
jgi:outer membrane protein assembly factor BamD